MAVEPNRHRRAAELLLRAAKATAVNSFVPLLDRVPVLDAVKVDTWDFALTVGGVFLALEGLRRESIGDDEKVHCFLIVQRTLEQWHPRAMLAYEDCRRVANDAYAKVPADLEGCRRDPNNRAADALGLWLFINVLDRGPATLEEAPLARVLGRALVSHLGNYRSQ